ncbi:hypothetical protein MICAE_1240015 [Microcystis aeruginosa PCC 9806]|uniref:Uncharacterized protein n=1 Tax=Microcystis aeruginosa PCC 9806 TaxID=1160282 RepID=I4GRB9_MICAE|nr:hypothetical protein MICAE_1240015 [Microcystis aeruginosa PCC 9806]
MSYQFSQKDFNFRLLVNSYLIPSSQLKSINATGFSASENFTQSRA